MLLQSLRPGFLAFQLVIEQTNLCLSLFPRAIRIALATSSFCRSCYMSFSTRNALRSRQRSWRPCGHGSVPPRASPWSSQCLSSLSPSGFFLIPSPAWFNRACFFFDLGEGDVEPLASIFVRFLRRRIFAAKLIGALRMCERRARTSTRKHIGKPERALLKVSQEWTFFSQLLYCHVLWHRHQADDVKHKAKQDNHELENELRGTRMGAR